MDLLPPVIEHVALEDGAYVFRDENILGTRMQVLLVAHRFGVAQAAALAARAEVDRLALILDDRDPASELSALNRAREHTAPPELFDVVAAAERWRALTQGAFSGRLGYVIDAWRAATHLPDRAHLAQLAADANAADVQLDATSRTIVRPPAVKFALDAIAKGWIVDRAFDVARNMPGILGALIDIGGDIRCGGRAPNANGWCIGIPEPNLPFDNAPLVATTTLSERAVATSGRGPRDRMLGGAVRSQTLSPFNGWPIEHHVVTSAIANTAADADAWATALLVMDTERALALADESEVPARITRRDGSTLETNAAPAQFMGVRAREASAKDAPPSQWQAGWQALATFTAPRRQLIRDPGFRSPYMAMWITDLENRPIRTLILVGKRAEWQKDNFIWWSINRTRTERLVATRSMSTSGAGVYNVFWDGVNDAGEPVAPGKYVLHVETSRERGKHTYRSLTMDFAQFVRFRASLPPTEEGGGLVLTFDHY